MMDIQLTVFNIDAGSLYDYTPLLEKAEITTEKTGAGKFTFSYAGKGGENMTEGAQVVFKAGGTILFVGYAFTIERSEKAQVNVTAYDQLRYLKADASYSFTGCKAGDIILRIARDFRLNAGPLEDTGYSIPTLTKEDTQCLDIIGHALWLTQFNTGREFIFFDNAGLLSLAEAGHMTAPAVIGSGSLLTEYKYKSDIDSDTYNQVKLVRPNKETGKADTYIYKDDETIKKWGTLQLYRKVDENLNEAQIARQGQVMMAYYDRTLRTLSVDCLGVPGVRAGSLVYFHIPQIPGLEQQYGLIADKVKHTFENGSHTMSIEAKLVK